MPKTRAFPYWWIRRHGIGFAILFTDGSRQSLCAGPDLFDHIQLVHGSLPTIGDALHDWVNGLDLLHRVMALVIRDSGSSRRGIPANDPCRGAVGVHGAVDDHCWNASFVRGCNLADVIGVCGIRKAFVMHHHIVTFRPIRIVVERDHRFGAGAAFVHDGPLNGRELADSIGERFALQFVIMAASTGDEQSTERSTGLCLRRRLATAGEQTDHQHKKADEAGRAH